MKFYTAGILAGLIGIIMGSISNTNGEPIPMLTWVLGILVGGIYIAFWINGVKDFYWID